VRALRPGVRVLDKRPATPLLPWEQVPGSGSAGSAAAAVVDEPAPNDAARVERACERGRSSPDDAGRRLCGRRAG
jgi:hypothetical protein